MRSGRRCDSPRLSQIVPVKVPVERGPGYAKQLCRPGRHPVRLHHSVMQGAADNLLKRAISIAIHKIYSAQICVADE
jgi:hypothetical protein